MSKIKGTQYICDHCGFKCFVPADRDDNPPFYRVLCSIDEAYLCRDCFDVLNAYVHGKELPEVNNG